MTRNDSENLLKQYIENESLLNHCYMVAKAMEAYAKNLGLSETEVEDWWTAGLLHDLDWEKYPDEHPNKAINDILPEKGYSQNIIDAIAAHGPDRTGKEPVELIERYLFACDELSGFINAVSLVRPTRFDGLEAKSVIKRLKDKRFAANVSRDDIQKGIELIDKPMQEHIEFLISVFQG
jgi:putative nucleotidyltransferase with HDIG domain